jgi:fructoselysine-6-P-deglycase FrlB-like protein
LLQFKKRKKAQKILTFSPLEPYRQPMSSNPAPFTAETHADREIASQPEVWRKVAAMAPLAAGLLPAHGERVAAVGCGSSWFMSMAYAGVRESAGHGETDYFAGSEFNYDRKYDRIVAISRSGTTTETVELLQKTKLPSVVITAVAGSPVTEFATESIILDFADEESVVQTRWATAALGLLRAHTGVNLLPLADQCEAALACDISKFVDVEQISFLGRGWTVGLAQEAALKTREAAQFWAEAYPAMDYRHGPMSIAQQGRATWAFGAIDKKLEEEIIATGALFEKSDWDPMVHLVKAQRVAIAIAKKRGLNPDYPRGLNRSVILN